MNADEFSRKFNLLIAEELKTCSKKNHDYSTDVDALSNFRKCEEFGIPAVFGCLVRMSDKDSRKIEVLLKGSSVSNETIVDTAKDDSVYNKIFILLWEEFAKHPYKKEIINYFVEIKKLLQKRGNGERKKKDKI